MKDIFDDPRVRNVNGIPVIDDYAPKSMLDFAFSPEMDAAFAGQSTNAPKQPMPPGAIDAAFTPALDAALSGAPGAGPARPAELASAVPVAANPAEYVRASAAMPTAPMMGTTTETQTTSHRFDPKALSKLDDAQTKQAEALDESVRIGQQRAAEEAGYIQQRNAELAALEQQRAREVATQKIELDYQQQRAREAQEAVAEKAKQDPDRWRLKGVGAQVMAGIGVALGAFGQALTGGPNAAMQILESAMEKEIRAMEREFDQAKDVAALEGNMFADLRRAGMDATEAYHASRRSLFEKANASLDAMAAKYKSPEIAANAQAMKAQLAEKAAAEDVKRSEATVVRHSVTAPLTKQPGGQQLPAGEAAKLGEANSAVQSMEALHSQWDKDARGVTGWLSSFLPMTDASRYENQARVAAQVVGSYLEGGKLTDTDFARYLKMLPQPGESQETGKRKMKAITELVANRQRGQKEALAGSGYNVAGVKDAAPNVSTFKQR